MSVEYQQLLDAIISGDVHTIKRSIPPGIDFTEFDHAQLTTLVLAACARKMDILNVLIERGMDLNVVNVYGETILLSAVKDGRYEAALSLIEAGADLDIRDHNGDNVAICAARLGVVEIVRKLILHGANVNAFDLEGNSPLCIAYINRQLEMVKVFVESGFQDRTIDIHDNTLLIVAARSGDVDLIHLLVHAKADLNFQNRNKFSALISAVQHQHLDVVQILTLAGSILDLTNRYCDTALTIACRDGLLRIVTFLLDSGANIEEGGGMRLTPLMQASFHGQLDVVHELLQRGANVNSVNVDGESALTCLNHARHAFVHEVCQMLVDHGAEINTEDFHQLSPLIKAIINENTNFAQILISVGADIEYTICSKRFTGRRKETPLILASRLGRADIVKCLLKHGADVNAKDRYDNTALNVASASMDAAIVQLLIEAGADINHTDSNGMTPLMTASCEGSKNVVGHLLEAGACANSQHFILEESALYYATISGFNEIVEMLMVAGAEVKNELHMAIKLGLKNVVRTLVLNGSLPTPSGKCLGKNYSPRSSKSPFFTSLMRNDLSIAHYLDSIWFFNQYDIRDLLKNKYITIQHASKLEMQGENNDLLKRLCREPQRLVILSFVAVSSAVGFHPGRAQRVGELKVPSLFKKRLLYQDDDAKLPVEEWEKLHRLTKTNNDGLSLMGNVV